MLAASDNLRPDSSSYLQNILDAPEHPDLWRLTTLVERLFHVPVAYMALLGAGGDVVTRIGSGTEYAPYLGGVRVDKLLEEPQLVRDAASDLPAGTDFADLRFAASALLRSTSGMRIGVLVIADREPRPDFSEADARTLADLAGALAGKMELRMIASLALESELSLRETERRFRGIANCAPVPLLYSGSDGSVLFVNKSWRDFSGKKPEEDFADGWADLIHPDHRDQVVEEYWRAFETLQPFSTKAPFRRHDGQYRWMLGKGAPRFREDASFAGYVVCLLDIADYRKVRCPCGRLCLPADG
jgi:PAS domain S-box-containing protein